MFLLNPFAMFGEDPAFGIQFRNTYNDTAKSSWSFAAADLGDPHSQREIFVAIALYDSDGISSATITGTPTIAGVNASIDANFSSSGSNVAFIRAVVPAGATGTIAFTSSATIDQCHIAVYRVINRPGIGGASSDNDPQLNISGTSDTRNGTTIPGPGFLLYGHIHTNTNAVTLTGATEDVDVAGTALRICFAHEFSTPGATPSVAASWSGSSANRNHSRAWG